MFRVKSLTKDVVTLSLALAVLWSLLACASLCTFESSLHESERSTCGETVAGVDRAYIGEPIEDCCLCPDISSPAGTVQQRETGEQVVSVGADIPRVVSDIERAMVFSHRTRDRVDDSPPKINAPPLFLRLRSFRI